MRHQLAHRGGRSSQATPTAVDKSQSALHTEILTLPRLSALLRFIATQRDHETGLLREFHFSAGGWDPKVVEATTELNWQSQNNHETIIFGHTLAGLFVGPAAQAIRDGEPVKVHQLTQELIQTANRTAAIHENGLTANAFELISGSPGFVKKLGQRALGKLNCCGSFCFMPGRPASTSPSIG